jgi:hypothetical protein
MHTDTHAHMHTGKLCIPLLLMADEETEGQRSEEFS